MDLGISVEELVFYFNIGLLATLGSYALFGFIMGLKKSLFYTLMFAGFVIGGFIISGTIARMLLDVDVSQYTTIVIGDTTLTTIRAFIVDSVAGAYPQLGGLLEGDTLAAQLVTELAVMVLRLVVVIMILVLAFTVWRFLTWIIWLFIKGKKKKKTLTSRVGGAALGAVRALLVILMIAVPLAGIASIASSLGAIAPDAQDEQAPYTLLLTSSSVTQLDTPIGETDLDQAIEMLSFYNQSWFAQAMGMVQIEGSSFDQLIFDQLFSFKFNNERIMLRQELVHVANVYSMLMEHVGPDNEINVGVIQSMGSETLEAMVSELSELKLIRVAILVGAEAVLEGNLFELEAIDLHELITMDQIMELDLKNEIENIGSALVNALDLWMDVDPDNINFFGFDTEKVEAVFDSISELGLIEILGPVGISMVMQSEAVTSFLGDTEIDLADLDWQHEISNFGKLYTALIGLGITSMEVNEIDFNAIEDVAIDNLSNTLFDSGIVSQATPALVDYMITNLLPEEFSQFLNIENIRAVNWDGHELSSLLKLGKVIVGSGILEEGFDIANLLAASTAEAMATYMSQSQLISGNLSPIIRNLLTSTEGLEFLSAVADNITDDFAWTKEELVNIFGVARLSMQMIGEGSGFDFTGLEESFVAELSTYMSESVLISMSMGPLVDGLLSQAELPFTLEQPEDLVWDYQETFSLLNGVRVILNSGITGEGFDFAEMSDTTIDEIAASLSGSTFLTHNLSSIFTELTSSMDLGGISLEIEEGFEWSNQEITAILKSARLIFTHGGDVGALIGLGDEDLDVILGSRLITKTLVSAIINYTEPGNALADVLVVSIDEEEWYDVYDAEERIQDGELRKLFKSLRILLGESPDINNVDFDINNLLNLEDEDMTVLLDSKVVNMSIVSQLVDFAAPGGAMDGVLIVSLSKEDPEWQDSYVGEARTDGELRKLLRGIKILLGESVDINNVTFDINNLLSLEDEEVTTLTASRIINETIVSQLVDYAAPGGAMDGVLIVSLSKEDPEWQDSYVGETRTDGELRKLLRGIKVLLGEDIDINNVTFDINNLLSLEDEEVTTLTASRVLNETIVSQLVDYAAPGGSLDGILIVNLAKEDPEWQDTFVGEARTDGELRKLLRGLKVLLGEDVDINAVEFDINNILNLDEAQTDDLLASMILHDSIVNQIVTLSSPGEALDGVLVVNQAEITWEDTYVGETRTDGELRLLLKSLKIVLGEEVDMDNVSFDVNNILFLDEAELNQLVASKVVTDSIEQQLITMSSPGESLDGVLVVPSDLEWQGESGEAKRLIRALEIVVGPGGDVNTIDLNVSIFFDEVTQPVLLASVVMEQSIIYNIENSQAALDGTLVIPGGTVWEGESGELIRFLAALEIIIGPEGDLDTLDVNVNVFFDEVTQPILLASTVIEATVIHTIETSDPVTNGTLIIPLGTVWEGESGELIRFLAALEVIIGPEGDLETLDVTVNIFFDEVTQPILLASTVIEATVIHTIETSQPALDGTLVIPVGTVWEGEGGELIRFLAALEVIIGPEGDLETLDVTVNIFFDEVTQPILLASTVIEATAIHTIETSQPALDGTLVIPVGTVWEGESGELIRFLAALEVIIGPEGDLETLDVTVNVFFDEVTQPILLASTVIEATVIHTIVTSDPVTNGTLIIPGGTVWEGESGELIRFLAAIEVLIGPAGDLETLDLSVNVFFDEVTQPVLLASEVVEASIINQIVTSQPVADGTLVIPVGTVWEGEGGELIRFLAAIEVLIGPAGDFNTLDLSVNVFFDEVTQPVLLASEVVEASIINQIETSAPVANGTLIIPVGTVWEGEGGELIRFLAAIEEIIGVSGDFDTLDLDVDGLLDKDLDILLTSRVLEASIVVVVEELFAPGGVLDDFMDLPGDTDWYRDYSDEPFVEGDLKPFLEAIRMMRDAGIDYSDLTLAAFQAADSEETADALLHSRIIAGNISKMLNKVLENAGVPEPPFGYRVPDPYTWTRTELIDALDTIKLIP